MIETYSFIIWMPNAGIADFEFANIICRVSDSLDSFFGESIINYKAAYSKKRATRVQMSREFMLEEIEASKRKRRDSIPLLFSYFSSLTNNRSFGFHISYDDLHYGSQSNIIINFPIICSQLNDNFDGMWHLFQTVVKEANPFFAFMPNGLDHTLSDVYWNQKPTYVHTFNYFGNSTVKKVGKHRLMNEPGIEITENGIFLKLLNEPLRINNPTHLRIQEEVSERLNLL